MVDLIEEEFFAGRGIDRFFNIAQIGPLTVLRQVPIITNAVSFAYIRRGEPFFTFALIDPNDHSVDPGLSDLFRDGVTFAPGIRFASKFFGKSGVHSFGGAVTTKRYTPFGLRSDRSSYPDPRSVRSSRSATVFGSITHFDNTLPKGPEMMAGGF